MNPVEWLLYAYAHAYVTLAWETQPWTYHFNSHEYWSAKDVVRYGDAILQTESGAGTYE